MAQRLQPVRFALPALARDTLVGRRAERANQLVGRIVGNAC
jgi:hypothetical protein